MASLSREQAREIIDDIREKNGGITQTDRERTPPSVLRSLESMQQKLGAAVRVLATNLYSSDTRFVFELIQNAEDNSYRCVEARDNDPFIKFTLRHDRVIVDSNEDGFAEDNVRAICSTGESTKTNAQGYIGEKGIGFKSVFKVASKVHVQSGPFSFYFEHRGGRENALGMVTPMPEEPEELPEGVRTRMTLTFLDSSKFDACVKEIEEVPDTLILFLSKLKHIRISIQPSDVDPREISYSCAYNASTSSMVLTHGIDTSTHQKIYKVVRRTLTGLPRDPARDGRDRAEVVLAFPVSDLSAELKPVCEDQYVFSFLPMRKVGYKFIVQSDFITQASREDIHRSAWNNVILDGVADTFCDAVVHFCHHPSLRWLWLDYIPRNISDPFWGELRDRVLERIRRDRVFLTWKERLTYSSDVLWVGSLYLDQHRQPLFDDGERRLYLSREYKTAKNFEDIGHMGVKNVSCQDILPLVPSYLCGPTPKIRDQDDNWHTRAAEMFLHGLSKGNLTSQIKALKLIPLANGTFESAASFDIFFPTDQSDILIPTDLPLRLVDRFSLTNIKRRELFERLGVRHCSAQEVIRLITRRYNTLHGVSLANSVSHLRYLYRTLPANEKLDPTIFLMDENQTRIYRRHVTLGPSITVDDLYFEDEHTYGVKAISHALLSTHTPAVHILHSSYLAVGLSDSPVNGCTWEGWLETVAGVLRAPRLRELDSLSTIFRSLAFWNPTMLLGVLKTYWHCYSESEKSSQVLKVLSNAKVCCGNELSKPLRSTYLPLQELKDRSTDLGISDDMPFVRLPTEWGSDDVNGWRFLATIGVGMGATLSFFLDALKCVAENIHESGFTEQSRGSLFKIYEDIYDCCRSEVDASRVRNIFKDLESVYVPSSETHGECLSPPEDCVWKGPSFLRAKSAIGFYEAYRENRKIKDLLSRVVKIPDADSSVYLDELLLMSSAVNYDNIHVLYQGLLDVTRSNQWENVRLSFERNSLVYIRGQSFRRRPSSCLWTTAPRVGNQFGIAAQYADLENLFVDHLFVQAPTVATYIEQLTTLSRNDRPASEEVLGAIQSINELNPTANDVNELRRVKFLPLKLRNGTTVFESPETEFFIANRLEYATAFEGKVSVLDFSLEQVRRFRPFLLALDLVDRYMSTAVEERTTVLQSATRPTSALTRQFREKARALLRCAVHFQSSKALNDNEAVFRMLREAQIYESEGFSKTLEVTQSGLVITAESARGVLHLEEDNDVLKIYVPRDHRNRRRCYATQFPRGLMTYLGINDPAATGIFQNVIGREMDIIDDILEEDGIIQVDLDDAHGDEGVLGAEESVLHVVTSNLSTGHANERPVVRPRTPEDHLSDGGPDANGSLTPFDVPDDARGSHGFRHARPSASQDNGLFGNEGLAQQHFSPNTDPNHRSNQGTAPEGHEDTSAYTRLLIQVSTAARRANLDMGSLHEAFASRSAPAEISGSPFGNRRLNQLEHDIKIGAAGELFVFELLSRLNLLNFGMQNWRSNIRNEVRGHPEYRDIEHWNGIETADFVYNDSDSVLSRFLSSNGRTMPNWRPRYFIEVKSTLSSFDTPFYMSKSQLRRLHNSPPLSHPSPDEVYLIFRIYNLRTDSVRFWIYKSFMELQFTPESYSVVPQPLSTPN